MIIAYLAAINGVYFVLMVLGFFTLRKERGGPGQAERDALVKSPLLPTVAVIAPACNEEATIRESVRSFLSLEYPALTTIVVNDGSSDGTLDALIDEFRLYRSSRQPTDVLETKAIRGVYESRDPVPLIVVDKENGGKADSLNAGLRVARSTLVAAVDADSLLEPGSLLSVVRPFLDDPTRTVATGGIVRVVNGCGVQRSRVERVSAPSQWIPLFQTVEYLRGVSRWASGVQLHERAPAHLRSVRHVQAFGRCRRRRLLHLDRRGGHGARHPTPSPRTPPPDSVSDRVRGRSRSAGRRFPRPFASSRASATGGNAARSRA